MIAKFSKHKIIEVIATDGKISTFKVPRAKVAEKAAKLLHDLPVADINIKEVAIEDVIRSVFTGKSRDSANKEGLTLKEVPNPADSKAGKVRP